MVVGVSSCWVDGCPGLTLTVMVEVKGVVSMIAASALLLGRWMSWIDSFLSGRPKKETAAPQPRERQLCFFLYVFYVFYVFYVKGLTKTRHVNDENAPPK